MATTDTGVILSAQPAQIQNPLDMATRAMQLKSLTNQAQVNSIKAQQAGQQFGDEQAVRQAYQNNVTDGPDGIPVLDKQGVLKDLGSRPWLQQQEAVKFGQQALAKQQQHMALTQTYAAQVGDQASYDQFKQNMANAGGANINQFPAQYDPNFFNNYKLHLQSIQAQQEYQQKQAGIQAQQIEARAKAAEAAANSGQSYSSIIGGGTSAGGAPPALAANKAAPNLVASNGQGIPGQGQQAPMPRPGFNPPPKMKADYMDKLNGALASARKEQPDIQQSYKDLQSADKINGLVGQVKDPNKINQYQLKILATELSKASGGGTPTESELDELTPNTLVQKYGSMLQNLTGKSTPQNAGEFIKQFQDYANELGQQGMARINANSNSTLERYRGGIGESNYAMMKGQLAHQFDASLTRKILRLQELRAKAGQR